MEKNTNNFFIKNKGKVLLTLCFSILLISIYVMPTLARFKQKTKLNDINVWDGSIAGSYRSGNGSSSDPYVISNGQELAYLLTQSNTNNYENTYFVLNNDIVLNDGLFVIDENKKYIKNDVTYYINGDSYYSESTYENLAGTLNEFASIKNFKGIIDGNYHTIYGLFMEDNVDELALFSNLQATIKNLYIENALVDGGYLTSILASSASNSNISDVLVSGNVINSNSDLLGVVIDFDDYTASISNETKTGVLNYSINDIYGDVVGTTLKGNLSVDGDATVTINGNPITVGDFELTLGSDIQEINISSTSVSDAVIEITNLQYIIDYNKEIASGLIAYSKNTEIVNSISKANINSNGVAAGLVGISNSSRIRNSYNTGNITSQTISGGLIGYTISDNNIVNNSYNTGNITGLVSGSLVAQANNSNLVIRNVFNTNNLYPIAKNNNSEITVYNSYTLANDTNNSQITTGSFIPTTLVDLKNKINMKDNMYYSEFVNEEDLNTNYNNVWLYNYGLPVLYFDSLTNPRIVIHASTYSWNDLGFSLDRIYLNSNISFALESYDNLKPVSDIYYYVSSYELDNNEIENITDWQEYTNYETISLEGTYVIYVKATDYEGNIFYANSDILILDKTKPSITITTDANTWNEYNNELDYIYIDENLNIIASGNDNLSGVKSIKYLITDSVKTNQELEELEFIDYTSNIKIDKIGNSIIYVEVIDNSNNKEIINTDYLVLNGYNLTKMYDGEYTKPSKNTLSVTDKSKVSFVYEYIDDNGYLQNYTHAIVSNTSLPENTKIKLVDLKNNEVYEYTVETKDYSLNENKYKYPLNLFKNIKVSVDEYFDDSEYYGNKIDEKFKVILDFSDIEIEEDINDISILLELFDDNKSLVSTLSKTIKTFSIYNNSDATSHLTSDYLGQGIIYNTNSINTFNLSTGIDYQNIGNESIIDTRYENMKSGIKVQLLDANDNKLSKEYLKNVTFKVNDVSYVPDSEGIYRIYLSDSLNSNVNISIEITEDNIKLAQGIYKINISNIFSYDGKQSTKEFDEINIPLIVKDNINNVYHQFRVDEALSYRIINFNNSYENLSYSILKKGWMQNPNIRVSLYEKEQLTAYNQDFIKVDLNEHISDNLESVDNMTYYAVKDPIEYYGSLQTLNSFNITILPKTLNKNEYKLVFELYDGNDRISTIEKYFIIK